MEHDSFGEMRRRQEERMRETQERMDRRDREMRERMEKRQREFDTRMAESSRMQEERMRETQERMDRRDREMRERTERRDSELHARMKQTAEQTEERLREHRTRMRERGYSDTAFEDLLRNIGATATDDLFSRQRSGSGARSRTQPPPQQTQAEQQISPAEATRRRVMTVIPPEKQKTLETFEDYLVTGVIATVLKAREVDSERTDWNIHLAYRRAIEVEEPDPTMVQKTQISGLLIQGKREEASYPF